VARIVAIVQARMGSTRLPRKVLRPLAGRPMVLRVVDRARRIEGVDEVRAAIPDLAEDDVLLRVLEADGVPVTRGPAADVLHRYVLAADASAADVVVRLTADCPLLSPRVSADVLAAFGTGAWDYASNTLERTWPRGLDTEVLRADLLRSLDRGSRSAGEREHVTAAVWRHPERYRLRSVRGPMDHSELRWTVDTQRDLAMVQRIYAALVGDADGHFEVEDILALLEREPALRRLNAGVPQKTVEA
jgi:spore coat polysaccharide biosynthesis protein SpsF